MPVTWIGLPSKTDAQGTPQFCPYIRILHSQPVPQPIFAAIITGAPWRWLQIPDHVLTRPEEAQLGYVRWRCRTHFRELLGTCYLFGDIVGFDWVKTPTEVVVVDTRGNVVGLKEHVTPAGGGTLRIGNKTIPGSIFK
jgi:hypothetical protein